MTLEPASVPPELERLTAIIERAHALDTAKEATAERIVTSHTEAVETARLRPVELAGARVAMQIAPGAGPE